MKQEIKDVTDLLVLDLPEKMNLNQPFETLRNYELFLTLKELSSLLGVTTATIRRDLKKLNLWKKTFKRNGPASPLKKVDHKTGKVCVPSGVVRELFQRRGFKYKPRVIAAQILKGGAGKTFFSLSLSRRYAQRGFKVLHIDMDHQSNSTKTILDEAINSWSENKTLNNSYDDPRIEEIVESLDPRKSQKFSLYDYFKGNCKLEDAILPITEHLHLMPSNISNANLSSFFSGNQNGKAKMNPISYFEKLTEKLKKHYEIIIFDCPPDINIQVIATAIVSDVVLIPVICETYYLDGLDMSCEAIDDLAEKQDPPISVNKKIVFNKYIDSNELHPRKLGELLNNPKYSNLLCRSIVREHHQIPNSLDLKEDFFDISGLKTSDDFPDYIKELDGVALELIQDNKQVVNIQ